MTGEDGGPVGRGLVGRVEDVLHGQHAASERPRTVATARGVDGTSLGAGPVGSEEHEGAHDRFSVLDHLQGPLDGGRRSHVVDGNRSSAPFRKYI